MASPCQKENEIGALFKSQAENRDLLIELKTLVESLVKYQMNEAQGKLKDHESRIVKLEGTATKVIAWSVVGSSLGTILVQIVINFIKK